MWDLEDRIRNWYKKAFEKLGGNEGNDMILANQSTEPQTEISLQEIKQANIESQQETESQQEAEIQQETEEQQEAEIQQETEEQPKRKLSKLDKKILILRNIHLAIMAGGLTSCLIGAGMQYDANEKILYKNSNSKNTESCAESQEKDRQFVDEASKKEKISYKLVELGLIGFAAGFIGTTVLEKTQAQEDRWFENTF
jgi:hypothetical protein